jgi:hypothetical protein
MIAVAMAMATSSGGWIKSKEGLVARTNVVLANCKSYICFIGYQN